MRFLCFTLYAPMCSFGEIAVGERRMSWAMPGRSAVLGLVAAAQGIERNDEAAHAQLEAGLYFAVRADRTGRPFVDYHTAQTPKARRGVEYATRRDELSSDNLNTVLSTREWRTDACFTAILWRRDGQSIDLDCIASALKQPRFVLYLGRKSAPLGLPLNPQLIEADTFVDAFARRIATDEEQWIWSQTTSGGVASGMIACDGDASGAPAEGQIQTRRDSILNRSRWQFSDRIERIILPSQEGNP
ncbi:MAG: type I-E CRISPR-associated protein Cas5/CasD [Gammaproteobacteria bacterium]|nr:type I-E CRISPR-associated protein Cas5/CasD [Gammaproteobacteria bacterium]MDE2655260.1 type I-E CRISPR-associated protein Cas5/CasD [Gemmatimonadota bacterium]MXW45219.1 type I-E CRISPR-associated protein Cas5/CasD [Gammaproteobacteria bacterium]MYD01135.1 type I-E CRISPR-associated protein Cas5/CasD [Gammaproteobacteria bacterium]MYI24883.1 type I-E CRISPR-associated protein Cas5/CasD [Gammaproteobacteria bacterium]